jgi:hypothetical protein
MHRRAKRYEEQGQAHTYIMTLSPTELIDATVRGGPARFINHSCGANCQTQKWLVGAQPPCPGPQPVHCTSCALGCALGHPVYCAGKHTAQFLHGPSIRHAIAQAKERCPRTPVLAPLSSLCRPS